MFTGVICSSRRVKRETSSLFVSSNTLVPDAPLINALTGGSGQFTATYDAVLTLVGGGSVTVDPITHYTFYWATTEAGVLAGGTPSGSQTTTNTSTFTRAGLTAGTWWVAMTAHNQAGASDLSFPYQVTVS